jgi:predicted DCC family thiol-disulfide oxidoreductase YuxK
MISSDPILIFDGFCNLCSTLVQFIIKRDKKGRIKFVHLQSEKAKSLISDSGINSLNLNSVVFISSGKLYLKSSAILQLFKELGRPWGLLYGFIIIPLCIRDSLYDLVARYRYRLFGTRNNCPVPAPGTEERFIN